MLTTAAFFLVLLGAVMIYMGIKVSLIPPAFTGIGFIVIGLVFLGLRDK